MYDFDKKLIYWSFFQRGKYKMFLYYRKLFKSDAFAFYKVKDYTNKYCKRLYKALNK